MKHNFIPSFLCAAALAVAMAACTDSKFRIDGEVAGAPDASVVLERSDFSGRWVAIDSTHTNGSGSFKFSFAAPAAPEIYRVRIGDSFAYVPVDSTEHISLKAANPSFAGYTLTGSTAAEQMAAFEAEAATLTAQTPDSVERFKRKVYSEIIQPGQAGVMSWHVLTKHVGDHPLFDPESDADAKYYGAVATAYAHYRPTDPRTRLLEAMALDVQRRRADRQGRASVYQATEAAMIDIELPDASGRMRRLSDMTSNGRPTVLIFGVMTADNSPAANREIASLYEKFGSRANFYEVCVDADQIGWRNAVKVLPWTVVIDADGGDSRALASYNVDTLPTIFLFNAKGELVSRAASFADAARRLSSL